MPSEHREAGHLRAGLTHKVRWPIDGSALIIVAAKIRQRQL
jgi:hypothetical protein